MVAPRRVLVVSTALDAATSQVIDRLLSWGAEVVRIDTELFPFDALLATTVADMSSNREYAFSCGAVERLESVDSIWYRRLRAAPCPPQMSTGVHEFCLRESRAMLLGTLLALD